MHTPEQAIWLSFKSNDHKWICDPVFWHNRKEMFLYKGADSGVYVTVESNGTLLAGTYIGGSDNITDALFHVVLRMQFAAQSSAINWLVQRISTTNFLNAVMSVRAMR